MNKKSITKAIYFFGIFAVTLATAFHAEAASIANQTSIITSGYNSVTSNSVVLTGSFSASGATAVTAHFDWGLTPSLGSSTPDVTYNSSSGQMTATLTNLNSNQKYFFRAYGMGNNNSAPGFGTQLSFTTLNVTAPSVITSNGVANGTSTATLTGSFNGNGASSTDVMFEYGTSASSLNQNTGFVTQNTSHSTFTATLSGLTANTRYYFRAVAKNSAGTTNAQTILSFTTSQVQPTGCVINDFYASPSTVNSGNTTALYYTTTDCTNVSIDNGIGSLSNMDGSYTTNAIYGQTTYTLTAYGPYGSTQTQAITVSIYNNNGNQCIINSFYASPSVVNSGSGTTIYWSTSNCYNVYISTYGSANISGSFTTGAIYGSTTYTISASGNNGSPSQTLTVSINYNPNPCTYNCNPCTYNCYPNPNPDPYYPPTPDPQIIYVYGGTNYYDTSYNVASVGDALTLSIDSGFPYIYPSDIFTYAIKYKNISSRNVNNAELSVDFPREVQLVGHSTGVTNNDGRSVTVSLGTLSPGESGVVNLDVRADNFLSKNDRVLAKASLTGTFSNGDRTSVSDYSIVSIKNGKNPLFSASAIFGENGFLPYTFGGWLLLIALVAAIIFVGKMLYERRKNVNAYGAHTYSAYPTNNEHDRNEHH